MKLCYVITFKRMIKDGVFADTVFPRLGGANPNLTFLGYFPKNCMKLKNKLDQEGGYVRTCIG